MRVLITGGAGYIGSHAAQKLLDDGHEVVIFDNLFTGFKVAVPRKATFVEGDIREKADIERVFKANPIDLVVHLAARLNVQESVFFPREYHDNNVSGLHMLLQTMAANGVKKIVFSSSGTIYGNHTQNRQIKETDPLRPVNPYGETKLQCEQLLKQAAESEGVRYCTLRYFNAAGAADNGQNGQRTHNAYHLIHVLAQAATGKRKTVEIFGTDYATHDGTCIRDYIHVEDLADIHVLASKYMVDGGANTTLNCGYGHGFTVREIVEEMKKVSGASFEVLSAPRRPGDPVSLFADNSKIKDTLGWSPRRDNLEHICRTAVEWEKLYRR